jgi:hypothetical protein
VASALSNDGSGQALSTSDGSLADSVGSLLVVILVFLILLLLVLVCLVMRKCSGGNRMVLRRASKSGGADRYTSMPPGSDGPAGSSDPRI